MFIKSIPILSETDIKRFKSKIKILSISECWDWLGRIDDGYGKFDLKNNTYISSRLAYYVFKNIDPLEKLVCHTCDNRKCCNPNHLFLGSSSDNITDAINKGTHSSVILKGEDRPNSKLTEEDIKLIRKKRNIHGMTYKAIGKDHNIHWSTAYQIANYITWRHIK